MTFVGRLHPLLIHFPIALVIAAALAEAAAIAAGDEGWRTVAIGNVRAGAAFALLATTAGGVWPWRRKWTRRRSSNGIDGWAPLRLRRRLPQRSRREAFAVNPCWRCEFTG